MGLCTTCMFLLLPIDEKKLKMYDWKYSALCMRLGMTFACSMRVLSIHWHRIGIRLFYEC